MKRRNKTWGLAFASIGIVGLMLMAKGSAQLALKMTGPNGASYDISARNKARGNESLVLYDDHFGKSTKTNGFGVEVVAKPLNSQSSDIRSYEVTQVSSVWECQKNTSLSCGNAEIPPGSVVFSATGAKRDELKNLKPGDIVQVQEEWFHQRQATINVINPTPSNNPSGSGFPGYRASNQIVLYNSGYARPTTGTNEFGFEVTVKNGIVTAQEGSDSTIPSDGYVLSGHGKGRSWLINNAPVGARIEISEDGQTLTSITDFDTYLYQFDQQWANSPCADHAWGVNATADQACNAIRDKKDQAARLYHDGQKTQAAAIITDALDQMRRRIWLSYQAFPANTIRGAWHRPVEKTPAAIGQTLDMLKASGINSVFLETFFHGYTIFPSKTYDEYGLTDENPKFAGEDLLKDWVEQAHKRNMQVHVWFQTFYGGTKVFNPPGPILSKHPDWANVQYSALVPAAPFITSPVMATPATSTASNGNGNGLLKSQVNIATPILPPANGQPVLPTLPLTLKTPDKPVASTLEMGAYFLDPANPQVQSFLMKLAKEIVSRYNVDGFQLDYIRYPASFPSDRFSYRKTTWGYTDVARKAFKAQYGIDPVDIDPKNPAFEDLWRAWNEYKVAQVSGFVQRVTQALRQQRPDIKISAAIFPDANSALTLKHQDWRTWGLNGWVDFFAPMTLTSAIKVVDRDTRNMVDVTHGKVPVYSGIFGPFNENSAEHVLSQIDTAKQAGAKGYVLFDTAHLTPRMLEALKVMQTPHEAAAVTPPVETITKPALNETPPAAKPQKHHWWSKN